MNVYVFTLFPSKNCKVFDVFLWTFSVFIMIIEYSFDKILFSKLHLIKRHQIGNYLIIVDEYTASCLMFVHG